MMWKKIAIGILGVTLVGGTTAVIYQGVSQEPGEGPNNSAARQGQAEARGRSGEAAEGSGAGRGRGSSTAERQGGGMGPTSEGEAEGSMMQYQTRGGGRSSSAGRGGNASAGGARGNQEESQASAEQWIELTGVIVALEDTEMTIETDSDETIHVELGPPHFWDEQGVTLATGDEVEVVGFYSQDEFMVSEITLVTTGDSILLRDTNGRPMWAGRGGSGRSLGTESTSG